MIVLPACLLLTDCKSGNKEKKEEVSIGFSETVPIKSAEDISIHQAALEGNISQVSVMLKNGTDVNVQDDDDRTALMYAAFNGHTEVIKILIERGADLNLCDSYGRTALMMASSGANPEAVKLFLDNQADPNMVDKEEHFTALMYAAAEGQMDVVKILLSYRADHTLKDIDGDDAMAFARNNGHQEIADMLLRLQVKK
jgi:ankyrin repeat protein